MTATMPEPDDEEKLSCETLLCRARTLYGTLDTGEKALFREQFEKLLWDWDEIDSLGGLTR